ncbi:MAG: hypothetical protein SGILL_009982 [Bacillariaceae sp.]
MPGNEKKYAEVPSREEAGEHIQNDGAYVASAANTSAATSTDLLSNDNNVTVSEQPFQDEPDGGSSVSGADDHHEQQLPHLQSQSSSPNNSIMTVDEAIEKLGMGPFQFIVLTAAGLCFAADAMQVLLLSFLSEVLRDEWDLTSAETAFITSILFVGAIFGTLILGPLADKKGRKPIFLLAAVLISVFGVATAMVFSYTQLLSCLFMVGVGVGGLTVPFDILAEFLPSNARGKNLLVIEYFWTIGVLFVVGMAYLTLGNGSNASAWRPFVVICTIPCWFSVLIGAVYVPESPRWLCTQGRCEEALSIIRSATKVNKLDASVIFPPGTVLEDEEEEEANFCELFSPRWRWTTLKLWGAWGFFAFGYYGTIMVITEIFDSENNGDNNDLMGGDSNNNTETYSFDYGAIFVSSSAELVGTTFAIFSIDAAGRIPLQVVSYAMAGIAVCSLCVTAANGAHRNILISLGFTARIFEMVGSCTSWVSTAEILTTEVRTTGHSAANAVARIGSLFAPFLIEGHSSLVKKGLVMLAIHAGTVVFVSMLPETKGSHMGRAHQDNSNETEGLVPTGDDAEHHSPLGLEQQSSDISQRSIT